MKAISGKCRAVFRRRPSCGKRDGLFKRKPKHCSFQKLARALRDEPGAAGPSPLCGDGNDRVHHRGLRLAQLRGDLPVDETFMHFHDPLCWRKALFNHHIPSGGVGFRSPKHSSGNLKPRILDGRSLIMSWVAVISDMQPSTNSSLSGSRSPTVTQCRRMRGPSGRSRGGQSRQPPLSDIIDPTPRPEAQLGRRQSKGTFQVRALRV